MTRREIEAADDRMTELPGFDVPNLDDMSTDPGDYAAMERVFGFLALYCEQKRMSMKHRNSGDIDAALSYESAMERTYNRLPKWARW